MPRLTLNDLLNRASARVTPWLVRSLGPARDALRWWLETLVDIARAVRSLFPWHASVDVRIARDRLTATHRQGRALAHTAELECEGRLATLPDALASLPPETLPRGSTVTIVLDPSCYLHKPLLVPRAVERHLPRVLELQLEHEFPMRRSEVSWTYRIAPAPAAEVPPEKLLVDVFATHRSLIDRLREACLSKHAVLESVFFEGEGARVLVPLPAAAPTRETAEPRWLKPAAVTTVLATLLAWPALTLLAHARERDAMTDASESLARSAKESRRTYLDATEATERLAVIARERSKVTIAALESELTLRWPAPMWVETLQVDGNTVRVTGRGPDAKEALERLRQSPLAQNAKLVSETSLGIVSGVRFEITFDRESRP
jgi:hypothetical protein